MSYTSQQSRYQEISAGQRQKYNEIIEARKLRDIEEADKAAQTAVKLKAGETVHDLLEKGFYRKTKGVMEQDYFKSTQIGTGDDAINLFSTGKTSDIPGSQLLIPDTPQVNPSAYEALGKELALANPDQRWIIPGAEAHPILKGDASRGKDMAESVWHTKIGEKYSQHITGHSEGIKSLNMEGYKGTEGVSKATGLNLTDEVIEHAGSLVEGEAKLVAEMGTWGKVGKALGPIGSVLSIGSGIKTLADSRADTGDKVAGAATLTSGVMTGTGAAIGAGWIGGGAAAGALGTTAAANFWNPVGWGIGVGAGLYGIGKGTGLF